MHDRLYSFFNNLSELSITNYYTNPVPMWIIDDFLPNDIFNEVVAEKSFVSNWTDFSNEYSSSKRKESRNVTGAPLLESLMMSFNSNKTVNWLESITETEGLIPDPHYLGGGFCKVMSGSKLDLHTDFNWNNRLRLNRKVNLMLYINKEWNDDWGGALEFWDNEKSHCIQRIEPLPNRLIFWMYDTKLIHGFPGVLDCPDDISRDNLIHFYYNSNSTWDEDPRRSQFVNNG